MTYRFLRTYYTAASALMAIFVSLMVIYGWATQSLPLVQIYSGSTVMQLNSALCFMLCGLSLLLADGKYMRLTPVLLFACMSIAFVTLLQDIFNVDYGIDRFFLRQPLSGDIAAHIARMAPNTAMAFMLLSAALCLGAIPSLNSAIARMRFFFTSSSIIIMNGAPPI